MKVTKELIKDFEADQKNYSTEVAINNLLVMLCFDLLEDLGYDRVKLGEKK